MYFLLLLDRNSITYLILLIPAVIFLSIFLKQHVFKSLPNLLLPLAAFMILQLIPLPRSPLGFSPVSHDSTEPWAVGLGFPFSTVKLYLGDGCLSGTMPCTDKHGFSYGYRLFHNGLISQIGTDFDIKAGDIIPTIGEMTLGAIFWLPLFLIAYIIAILKLRGIQPIQKGNYMAEIFGFLILLLVVAFLIAPEYIIYAFSPVKWGQQCFTRYVPTYTPPGFVIKETNTRKKVSLNCSLSGYISFDGYKDPGRKITVADAYDWMVTEYRDGQNGGGSQLLEEQIKKQDKQFTVLSDRKYVVMNEVSRISTEVGIVERIGKEETLVGIIGDTAIAITNSNGGGAAKISPEEMVKIFIGLKKN